MDKALFWVTIVIVSIIGIVVLKYLAGISNVDGLKSFMAQV